MSRRVIVFAARRQEVQMRGGKLMMLAALAWPGLAIAQPSSLVRCDEVGLGMTSVAVGADLSGVRSYYEGSVTLLAVDQVEPACCSYGVAVIMPEAPSEDEPTGMSCWAMTGYAGVDVGATTSRYTPNEGLTLTIPTRSYDPETGGSVPGAPIRLRINAGRGTIVDLGAAAR